MATENSGIVDYLLTRRSVMAQNLNAPAPSDSELEIILTIGARVPDHGKLSPWYFMVFSGDHRDVVGRKIQGIYAQHNPMAKKEHLDIEGNRFSRAPLVIGVISRVRAGKPPLWEQILSSGASCMNIVHAANAMGYGAQWLSEWYSFDEEFKDYIGVDRGDHIAGFIHIGSVNEKPDERPRPDLTKIVTHWEEGCTAAKGDEYASGKFGYSNSGFDLSDK